MTLNISTTEHSHDPQAAPTVLTVESLLHGKGYYSGRLDGIFGPMCYTAVRHFQTHVGILSDGVVGPVTFQHLRTAPAPASVSAADFANRCKRRCLGTDGHPRLLYTFGAKDMTDPFPTHLDCSGLVTWGIYQDCHAVWANGTWAQSSQVHRVSVGQALAIKGALLFESTDGAPSGSHHVGVSLGDGIRTVEAFSAHFTPETGVYDHRHLWNLAGLVPVLHY